MKNNYRKILILLVLLAIVAIFTISPTFAATKTVKLNNWPYCYYDNNGTAYMVYNKEFKVGSTKFTAYSAVGVDFKKGNKFYYSAQMIVNSNKKFKSATFYKFNVKTLKVSKKTVKTYRIPKEWGSEEPYVATYYTRKSSNWVPYKIVINY